MKIRIVYCEESREDGFYRGDGLSLLVDDRILFDTGDDPEKLRGNLSRLGIDTGRLEYVVISHDHNDHTGGLEAVLSENNSVTVYGCPGFSIGLKEMIESYGAKYVMLNSFAKISKNIYSTGEMKGFYKSCFISEQGLVLSTAKGVVLLTGCAHPGILRITEAVRLHLPVDLHMVMGGFHLRAADEATLKDVAKNLKKMHINKVGALHCSGDNCKKILKDIYGTDFIDVKTGDTVQV